MRFDRSWEGTSEIQRVIMANELINRGTRFLDRPRQEGNRSRQENK